MLTVDEIKNVIEPEEVKTWNFIDRKLPDRKAAAERYYIVQDLLYSWHGKLNDKNCNTREMPEELLKLYDEACDIMVKISKYERKLSE